MKATAVSHPDVALVKYWGKATGENAKLRIPTNGSISIVLSELETKTTVEFSSEFDSDELAINGEKASEGQLRRVVEHLDRVRNLAGEDVKKMKAHIHSETNFPMSAGISSSASGFSALTVAATSAAGLTMSKKELSMLARQASGSACRPIMDGFVEWLPGVSHETSYAESIFSQDHWNICDVLAIISYDKKTVPTTVGMAAAQTSPFFEKRLENIDKKISDAKKFIAEKNFAKLGELVEAEALEMHAIALTSQPPLLYWLPETVVVMKAVQKLRAEGLPVYFTINTGQNVHILAEEKNVQKLKSALKEISEIREIIVNRPSIGARLIQDKEA